MTLDTNARTTPRLPTLDTGSAPGLAILGVGFAGAMMLSAALVSDVVNLVAVADVRADEMPLSNLPAKVHRYTSLDALLGDESVDVVHIATPTPQHLEQAAAILDSGRHVIVEKPMTIDAKAARTIVDLAALSDRILVVGHSSSYEPYVQAAAAIVESGLLGDIEMITVTMFTNWLRRPRLAEELDPSRGGGLVRRQGVHEVDMVRTILGGGALSVREARLRPDRGRNAVGSYLAWLKSERGATAVLFHDGVGGVLGHAESAIAGPMKEAVTTDEALAKHQSSDRYLSRVLGGELNSFSAVSRGEIIVLGTNGDLVATCDAVTCTDGSGTRSIDLGVWPEGRAAVLLEFVSTLAGGQAHHDAMWGYQNIRICEEIESIAQIGR
jgi:phthalate 4,5-cis-dihydrodiol dehydrogenase